ncbi:MAG TPA: hypothetical protein VF841_03630 [Anaeromyxobacter sp.]
MRRVLAFAALIVLASAAPGRAAAATFVATSVEEVARTSDAVVRGRVARTAARATRDGRIVTEVEIAVRDAWKGAPAATVRVVVPGGRLPGVAMRVDAAPSFAPGEEVVVFLSRGGEIWYVNGLALGKFRVDGASARPALGGAAVLPRPVPLAAGERQVGPMPVAELERRVRAAR